MIVTLRRTKVGSFYLVPLFGEQRKDPLAPMPKVPTPTFSVFEAMILALRLAQKVHRAQQLLSPVPPQFHGHMLFRHTRPELVMLPEMLQMLLRQAHRLLIFLVHLKIQKIETLGSFSSVV